MTSNQDMSGVYALLTHWKLNWKHTITTNGYTVDLIKYHSQPRHFAATLVMTVKTTRIPVASIKVPLPQYAKSSCVC